MKQGVDKLRAKQRSRSGPHCKVHPGSRCLGNLQLQSIWAVVLRNFLSDVLPCVEMEEVASPYPSDLDSPDKSGMLLLVVSNDTVSVCQ